MAKKLETARCGSRRSRTASAHEIPAAQSSGKKKAHVEVDEGGGKQSKKSTSRGRRAAGNHERRQPEVGSLNEKDNDDRKKKKKKPLEGNIPCQRKNAASPQGNAVTRRPYASCSVTTKTQLSEGRHRPGESQAVGFFGENNTERPIVDRKMRRFAYPIKKSRRPPMLPDRGNGGPLYQREWRWKFG